MKEIGHAREPLGRRGGFRGPTLSRRQDDQRPDVRAVLDDGRGARLLDRLSRGLDQRDADRRRRPLRGRPRGAPHDQPHDGDDAGGDERNLGAVRPPRLRTAFLDSGGVWTAPWLDRMDSILTIWGSMIPPQRRGRAELFRRNCWISFEPVEGSIAVLADYIGPHKIMWATDYPHQDGLV